MGIISAILAIFGSSCSKKSVHVEFINHSDKSVIGVVDLPPENLPDSFAVDTSFDIADKKWSVVQAEPINKAEFIKSGQLRVYLLPVTTIPIGDLLYSLPTISDDIGVGEGTNVPDEKIFQIHEDDWRQIEFVSQAFAKEIAQEFEDIHGVYEGRKPGGGFSKVHVRKRIPLPLEALALTVSEVETALPPQRKYDAVGVHRSLGKFQKSFAWDAGSSIVVWGTTDDTGKIRTLCLGFNGAVSNPEIIGQSLEKLCSMHKLYLIDWCRAAKGLDASEIQKIVSR